jgi:hypothetical protein
MSQCMKMNEGYDFISYIKVVVLKQPRNQRQSQSFSFILVHHIVQLNHANYYDLEYVEMGDSFDI